MHPHALTNDMNFDMLVIDGEFDDDSDIESLFGEEPPITEEEWDDELLIEHA